MPLMGNWGRVSLGGERGGACPSAVSGDVGPSEATMDVSPSAVKRSAHPWAHGTDDGDPAAMVDASSWVLSEGVPSLEKSTPVRASVVHKALR
ncbi:unnamed protein product [Merluccius merluccius]